MHTQDPFRLSRLEDDQEEGVNDDLKYDSKRVLEQACEFFLYSQINTATVESLAASMLKMALVKRKRGKKPAFVLHILSDGGSVAAGLALGAAIRQVQAQGYKVVTRIEGIAASMAFIVAQYGDVRQIDAMAQGHIHNVQYVSIGSLQDHADTMGMATNLRNTTARIYANRNTAGHTDPQYWLDNYFDRAEHYITSAEALELGLVDEIVGGYPTQS